MMTCGRLTLKNLILCITELQMYKILVQLHDEGDSLMFQGFFKLEVALAERDFSDLLSYQSTPKYSVEGGFTYF